MAIGLLHISNLIRNLVRRSIYIIYGNIAYTIIFDERIPFVRLQITDKTSHHIGFIHT